MKNSQNQNIFTQTGPNSTQIQNQYIIFNNSQNKLSPGSDSSMFNHKKKFVFNKNAPTIKLPNAQFKYYNFHDRYLITILISIIVIGIAGLFYVERINIIFILLIFLGLVVLYLSKLINIIQTLDVYDEYFMHDKIQIKFELIQSINKFGHYISITYIEDLLINEAKKYLQGEKEDLVIDEKDITYKKNLLTDYINFTYKKKLMVFRLPTRITFTNEQDIYKFIDEYKKSKINNSY